MKTQVAQNGGSRKASPIVHKAGKWQCPRCKNTIQILVPMTVAPCCCNHIGKAVVVMERIGK